VNLFYCLLYQLEKRSQIDQNKEFQSRRNLNTKTDPRWTTGETNFRGMA